MGSNMWTKILAKVKKFGLDYDDFPTMVENISLLLRILSINIDKNRTKRIHVVFYIMTLTAVLSYFYVYVFCSVWLVYFIYGIKEIEATFLVLALSSCSAICFIKLVFMKLYSKEIKITVDNYLKCNSQVIPNTRFAKNLRTRLKVVKRRASIIWIFLMSDGLVFLILPLVTPGRNFSVELYLLYGLEPMHDTPNYEIAISILTISSGFAAYTMVNISIFVIIIVGYNEAQMHALSEELRNVWNDSQIFYNQIKHKIIDKRRAVYIKQQIRNEFIKIRLRDIIKFHIANINLHHELDQELRPTLAVEYTIMALAIITELLGGLENTYLVLPYTIVLILMDCLAGQRLIDACNYFEESIYSCQWENFNKSNQGTVLLMLTMSQKTLMLSAGGVNKLDFSCMMAILKSSYSTYTTLKSTVKKHN